MILRISQYDLSVYDAKRNPHTGKCAGFYINEIFEVSKTLNASFEVASNADFA